MNRPLELAAVKHDDELLDRIGQGRRPGVDEEETVSLLAGWRADLLGNAEAVDESPMAHPYAVPLLRGVPGRSVRGSLRLAAVAAALMALVSSLGVAAAAGQAAPDSRLFPLTKLVAHQHAESVQARDDVQAALELARRQGASGHAEAARATLLSAQRRLAAVRPGDGREDLRGKVRRALSLLAATPRSPSPSPSAPSSREAGDSGRRR